MSSFLILFLDPSWIRAHTFLKRGFWVFMRICSVKKCGRRHVARGYCDHHYQQIRLCGKILTRTPQTPNQIIECRNFCKICLYNRKYEVVAHSLINKRFLKKVKKYKWSFDNFYGYAFAHIGERKIFKLHHFILGRPPKGKETDHINGNRLDNRIENLRFVTRSQNNMNRKDVKGYSWNKKIEKWETYIEFNHKRIRLGFFVKKSDAIAVRKQAEQKYFGSFAYQL